MIKARNQTKRNTVAGHSKVGISHTGPVASKVTYHVYAAMMILAGSSSRCARGAAYHVRQEIGSRTVPWVSTFY